MPSNTNTVLFIGRPGSGKGTQARMLSEELGWLPLSSGDRFKSIRDGAGPLAERVREGYDKGEYMPDWFADYLLESGILELDATKGVVMEGFARTRAQAEHLVEIMQWLHRDLKVIHLDVSEEAVKERMLARAKIEHRPDSDAIEKIEVRLAEFRHNTEPALAYLREKGLVTGVDGTKAQENVAAEVLRVVRA